jgi:hypothetical protein
MIKKCSGCGIELQTGNKDLSGYVRDMDMDLCYRCFRLKNYGEYIYLDKNNDDFEKILGCINDDDLVVYVSSLLNLNLDYIKGFKRCILALTKRDILPKSIIDAKIIKYVLKNNSNLLDIYVVSSIHNYNLDNLYQGILKHSISHNIYFVGNTNAGKSTLLNKLLVNYTDFKSSITTSYYPSTTIDRISISVNDNNFIDTPGLINIGSIVNYVDNATLKRITPKKEIKPITYQLSSKGSLFIDNLVRIDYSCVNTSMTVYINNGLKVKKINSKRDDFLEYDLREFNNVSYEDIVIQDLCFIKFTNSVDLKIYTYNKVAITRRSNLI